MSRADWQHLYKQKRWKIIRGDQLRKQPMCECPHCQGHGLVATVVHHKVPHKGNRRLFFDRRNLQSAAKECHDRFFQSAEKGGIGFDQGCDEQGFPLNGEHFWYNSDVH